ncbi:uncharacterized protein FTJAE_3721 [Fusarium tjaetaba]|uniref:Uncharacterized protein n=1 Tax=Fusarium tjaetaba TaxID=1567544 RepID=A0A8H5S1Q4_9HYPO|nr:uncharacterized protein FTJAE_3721 [Fusarium tjaetaba]KAF5642246.1 hypothetical protein FTJAE_3721 [Fusarium tjaetaba]
MRVVTSLALIVVGVASLACCDSKFIQPPESSSKQPSDTDMTKNKRYEQGAKIQIKYETDIDQIAIEIYQIPLNGVSAYRSLARNGSENPTYWLAEYDFLGLAEGNEDSVYWFTLFKSSQGQVARSDYFNVSSPQADETTSARSELSQGATAGVAAGAIIGGLLILGGIGLLVWRRFGNGRKNIKGTEEAQDQQHQFYPLETKVELPSDITTHPSEYATSRPGLHEAP